MGVCRHHCEPILRDNTKSLESGDRPSIRCLAIPVIHCGFRLQAKAGPPMHDHTVAGLHMRDFGADFQYGAAAFVAKEMWQPAIRAFNPINLANLRAADTRCGDLDEDLAEAQWRDADFVEHERLFLLHQDGGGCFHDIREWRVILLPSNLWQEQYILPSI